MSLRALTSRSLPQGNISLFQRTTEATIFIACVYVREFVYAYFFIPLRLRSSLGKLHYKQRTD